MFFYGESSPVAAFGSLGGVTYTAKVAGTAGNSIVVTHVTGAAAVAGTTGSLTISAGIMPNITTFTLGSKSTGSLGNIAIDYQNNPGLPVNNTAQASYNSISNTIVVQYRGTPNISSVRTAISGAAGGNAGVNHVLNLVSSLSGIDRAMTNFTDTSLTGSTNAVAAQTTAVTVGANNANATAITIRVAVGETIGGVITAVSGANTSVTASGVSGNAVTSRTGSVTLSGGSN